MNRSSTLVLLALSLAMAACSKKAPPTSGLPPAPGEEQVRGHDPNYDADGNYIGPGSQADLRRVAGSDRVFFELDSYLLDEADRQTLRRHANWLAQYPQVRATIEGHCDERGTRDYNLALGERRANAAKNYLVSQGVDAGRLAVASHGKERPEALGSDEASYAQNRRAVTVVVR
jgi:peptidoglycan-associated lipoprotein